MVESGGQGGGWSVEKMPHQTLLTVAEKDHICGWGRSASQEGRSLPG